MLKISKLINQIFNKIFNKFVKLFSYKIGKVFSSFG